MGDAVSEGGAVGLPTPPLPRGIAMKAMRATTATAAAAVASLAKAFKGLILPAP